MYMIVFTLEPRFEGRWDRGEIRLTGDIDIIRIALCSQYTRLCGIYIRVYHSAGTGSVTCFDDSTTPVTIEGGQIKMTVEGTEYTGTLVGLDGSSIRWSDGDIWTRVCLIFISNATCNLRSH